MDNDTRHSVLFYLTALIAFSGLLVLFNLLPGFAPNASGSLSDISFGMCLENAGHPFGLACRNFGYPFGAPSTFGLPVHALIAALAGVLQVSTPIAMRLTYVLCLGVALLGAFRFFEHIALNRWLALLGAVLFLASPIVSLEDPYGPLRLGFALLPAATFVNLKAIDSLSAKAGAGNLLKWLTILSLTFAFCLFCDGYSYVMELLLTGALWFRWILAERRARSLRIILLIAAVPMVSVLLSVAAYKAYIPGASYSPMPLAFFRAQGIDLFMFFAPASSNWLANVTGLHHSISGYQVYSDGPSSSFVYLGYSFLLGVFACLWLAAKGEIANRRTVIMVLAVGLAAMLLSLGPALKWHDFRTGSGGISFDNYMMPAGNATLELGTGWIYEHVPGIKVMRALYRWQLLVRLALITAAIAWLAAMVRRRKYVLSVVIAVALIAETLPAFNVSTSVGRWNDRMISEINAQPGAEFRKNISPGEKVVLLQLHPNASTNEYLASYLCAIANARCYNTGGDKSEILSSGAWPAAVFDLINGRDVALNARDIFRFGLSDTIVVPFFDLRMQAYSWPAKNFPRAQVEQRVKALFPDENVKFLDWFAIVRPVHAPTADIGHYYNPAELKAGHVATVENWGPKEFKATSKSQVYIWMKAADMPDSATIALGNHVMASLRNSDDTLACPVRASADRSILRAPGQYPVYLIDKASGIKQELGSIKVRK